MLISSSAQRLPAQSSARSNERIRRQTDVNIAYYSSRPELIDRRIAELDSEWDIERVLETAASGITLAGLLLGIGVNRKVLLLPLAVQVFLMQHALQGWCPPLPVLLGLGVRTPDE